MANVRITSLDRTYQQWQLYKQVSQMNKNRDFHADNHCSLIVITLRHPKYSYMQLMLRDIDLMNE